MLRLHSWLVLALVCAGPVNAQVLTNATASDPLEGAWIRVEEIRHIVGPAPAEPDVRTVLTRERDGWYAFPAAPGIRLFVQGYYSAASGATEALSSGRYESEWQPGTAMSAGLLVQYPIERLPAGAGESEIYGYQLRADSLFITRLIDKSTGPAPGTPTMHFIRAR